ncbi:hypothetical protein [Mycolicibacterium mengxianglii]|uniref:hypothetical protein n=1 Tax=Mycolicibacterium mengxianglii TaxID=2736649 RepID=UPI0018D1911D|nr:hypothetical protein [Mycolicibacterium mengxianglii]
MKKIGVATTIAAVVTAGFLGLSAPAVAAPTGTGNAQDTISSLEAQGYHVIVNRLSDTPLKDATVVSVGEGPTFQHSDTNLRNHEDYTGHGHEFGPANETTIYVTVK